MNIGLDFDGVIADTTELKVREAKALFDLDINPKRSKEHQLVEDGVMTSEQYRELMDQVCANPDTGLTMVPRPEAIGAVKGLLHKHKTIVITSRGEAEVAVAKTWCMQQGFDLQFISIGYGKTKTQAAKEHSIEVFMDDDLHKLIPLVGAVPHLFLFSTEQNADDDSSKSATRVSGWLDFLDHVTDLSSNNT